MNKKMLKKATVIALSVMLTLLSAFTSFAEAAKEVSYEGGRSVIVQEVKLEDENASVAIARGTGVFTPSRGVRLAEGDAISTKGNAVIYLAVDARMALRIDNNSEAVIEKSTFGKKLVVRLVTGHMFYNVAKEPDGAESLELMSNNVTIAIRGTSGELGSQCGKTQHQLYDGVVEVFGSDITFEQKAGQMVDVEAGPANSVKGKLSVREFTLAEVPASVIEEMKKDKDLRGRVLNSVPLSVDSSGKQAYADEKTFLETVTGTEDRIVFEKTSREKIISTKETSMTGQGAEPETTPPTEPETTPPTEPETTPPTEPETTPPTEPKETCPACGSETVHEKESLPCGHEEYSCKKADHALLMERCPHCDQTVYACYDAKDRHTTEVPQECGHILYQCNLTDSAKKPHEKRTCEACRKAGKPEAEYTYFACDKGKVALHEAYCQTCRHSYCPASEGKLHEEITYDCGDSGPACQAENHKLLGKCEICKLYSYACREVDLTGHQSIKCETCSARSASGQAVYYCPIYESSKADGSKRHDRTCSLADGGCGQIYCEISGAEAHAPNGTAICSSGHSLRKCVKYGDDVFACHNGIPYTCTCGTTFESCTQLTADHDVAYCPACGEYHKKCKNHTTTTAPLTRSGGDVCELCQKEVTVLSEEKTEETGLAETIPVVDRNPLQEIVAAVAAEEPGSSEKKKKKEP